MKNIAGRGNVSPDGPGEVTKLRVKVSHWAMKVC